VKTKIKDIRKIDNRKKEFLAHFNNFDESSKKVIKPNFAWYICMIFCYLVK